MSSSATHCLSLRSCTALYRRGGLRIASLAAVLFFALLVGVSTAAAAEPRTEDEIRIRWSELHPVYSGFPYIEDPLLAAPYAPGTLARDFLQDGLNCVNYARYLAGLPDDVALDPARTAEAQHGAVLLATSEFSHRPSRPGDMSEDFYGIAVGATGSGNIGWGYSSLWGFNRGCLDDEDSGNIDRVGHRRWLLNPDMAKTGMGFAELRAITHAFDRSRTQTVAYDAVRWPSAGPFPVEMLSAIVPWSISLNPDIYTVAGLAGYTVVLRRVGDGRTWTFDSSDTDKAGEYFNLDTRGYGIPNCFIFRPHPESVGTYSPGDVFEVRLTGPITTKADGKPAVIEYTTSFISHSYTLTYTAGTGGSISGTSPQTVNHGASGTAVTAVPAAGYRFVRWSDGSTANPRTDTNVTASRSATASFAINSISTSLTFSAPSTSAYASAKVSGYLKDASGNALVGQPVEIWHYSGGWKKAATVYTDSNGYYAKTMAPKVKTRYRAYFAGDITYLAKTSTEHDVLPRVKLTRPTSWKTLAVNKTYYAKGYIAPKHAKSDRNKVKIRAYKKRSDGSWRYVKSFTASYSYYSSTKTRYKAAAKLTSKGSWKLVAYHASDSRNAKTYGSADYVKVK